MSLTPAATRRPHGGGGAQVVQLGAGAGADVAACTATPAWTLTSAALAGLWAATCGASAAASKSCHSASAPGSLCQCAISSGPRTPASRSQASVVASGATRPTCEPSSALMLDSVMRSCMDSARTASPQNSTAW